MLGLMISVGYGPFTHFLTQQQPLVGIRIKFSFEVYGVAYFANGKKTF